MQLKIKTVTLTLEKDESKGTQNKSIEQGRDGKGFTADSRNNGHWP